MVAMNSRSDAAHESADLHGSYSTDSVRPRGIYRLMIIAGITLAVLAIVAFVAAAVRMPHPLSVLVAAHDIAPGQVLDAKDLSVVRLVPDPSQDLVVEARQSSVVGRSVRFPVPAGTLISEAILGPSAWPPGGQALVAVMVDAARAPMEMEVANRVLVQPLTGTDPTNLGSAVVMTIQDTERSGNRVVSLLTKPDSAQRIARVPDAVSLVIVSGQE